MKLFVRSSRKTAQAPGTLTYVGEHRNEDIRISVINYDEKNYEERNAGALTAELLRGKTFVQWVNIDGVHSAEVMEQVGKRFDVDALVLEDIMHTGHRPKAESFANQVFITMKMLDYNEQHNEVKSEQVSLVVGPDYLISFQEKAGDVFDPIRNRIKNTSWRERRLGTDYLAYALLDAVVDHYFILLEKIGEQIETLEKNLTENPTPDCLTKIHQLKKEMIILRKSVWPLREVVAGLQRDEHEIISGTIRGYFRDVYDHTVQVVDTVESYRDVLSSMQDLYLSSVSNRMNEVMKVLTLIATVFIPPTFIAGIYGMNFAIMPELKWPWGYGWALSLMLAMMISMYLYFKSKKWI